jgi:hypothetical protein
MNKAVCASHISNLLEICVLIPVSFITSTSPWSINCPGLLMISKKASGKSQSISNIFDLFQGYLFGPFATPWGQAICGAKSHEC